MAPEPDIASIERRTFITTCRLAVPDRRLLLISDKRGIEHSYTGNLKESPGNSHTEMAIIRGPRSRVVRRDVQIIFKFDDADSNLVSYSVREIFTGP